MVRCDVLRCVVTINFSKCREEIERTISECASSLSNKYNIPLTDFDDWVKMIKQKTLDKIRELKSKIVPQQSKPILENEEVKNYLKEFHEKYVIVPIDKAANNIAVICKRFYVFRLLQEIGVLGTVSSTYELSEKNRDEIISNNIQLTEQYGLKLTEKQKLLPIMYWTPKDALHPIKSTLYCFFRSLQHKATESCGIKYFQASF